MGEIHDHDSSLFLSTMRQAQRPPISRLPSELLDAVFVLLASDAISEHNPYRPYDPLEPSRIVSHVSSFWRDIALKNSSLWSQIMLVNCWERKKNIEWIKYMIKRTRDVPITLRLWVGSGWDEEWDQNMALILTTILPRIEVLDLRLENYGSTASFRKALAHGSAPLLASLKMAPFDHTLNSRVVLSDSKTVFPTSVPKLTRVQYEFNRNYVPYFSLSSRVTHFKIIGLRDGKTWFTLLRCIQLLRSLPLLEDLSLSVEFTKFVPNRTAHSHNLQVPRLKYLFLDATCRDCAVFLDRFTFNPGCVLDIQCMNLRIDKHHDSVRDAMYHYAVHSQLDVTDKCVTIALERYEVSLVVWPPNVGNVDPVFRFSTIVSKHVKNSRVEDDDRYIMLFLLVRMAHLMKLTKCSELHLNVNVELPVEDRFAPILGPLIRTCKNAKRLVLGGTERNGFMAPVLLAMGNRAGTVFDVKMFADIDEDKGNDDKDRLFLRWKELMQPTQQVDVGLISGGGLMGERCGRITLRTVRFLYTNFDMTTVEGQSRLANLLAWKRRQGVTHRFISA